MNNQYLDNKISQQESAFKTYLAATIVSFGLLFGSAALEVADKVPDGTTTSLLNVAKFTIDKSRKVSQDANRMLEEALKNTKRPPNWPLD